MSVSTPRRDSKPTRTAEIRKPRGFRPRLDPCEARVMLSGASTSVVLEPLQFSAAAVSRSGLAVNVEGTLRLTESSKGGLSGSLSEANGKSLRVQGTLRGEQIDLRIGNSSKTTIHAAGPVVSAQATDGPTLHGGGLILKSGPATQGTFTIQGSNVVLPAEQLPNPKGVARVIPAGTTLVTSHFVGTVTQGPDLSMTLSGSLSLGKVSNNGSLAGSLADPVLGTVPVSGRIVGGRIQLNFDFGAGGKFGGVGPFVAQKVGKGQEILTSFGSLQTGNPADSGNWSVTNSPLSHQNLSSQAGYNLSLNNNLLVGTNFMSTGFFTLSITNSTVQSVNFSDTFLFDDTPILKNSTFQGVNFTGANLHGADLTGSDLSGANVSSAALAFSTLTGTKLPSNLIHTYLDGDDLSGRQFVNNNLSYASLIGANLAGANLTGANLTGANLTGANLHGTIFTNATGLSAKAQLDFKLQNRGGVGLDLSAQDLSGDDLDYVNLTGANLTGANLTNTILNGANLTGATLTHANFSNTQLTQAILTNDDLSTVTLAMPSSFNRPNLNGANLSGTNLSSLMLQGYDMVGANLSRANLAGTFLSNDLHAANFTGANLYRSRLIGADLAGANFTNANLTATQLIRANLRGAIITGQTGLSSLYKTVYQLQNSGGAYGNFSGIDLEGQDLTNVDLTRANLTNVNLFGADLTGANLTSVIFSGATLTAANFAGANLSHTGMTAATLRALGGEYDSTTIFS